MTEPLFAETIRFRRGWIYAVIATGVVMWCAAPFLFLTDVGPLVLLAIGFVVWGFGAIANGCYFLAMRMDVTVMPGAITVRFVLAIFGTRRISLDDVARMEQTRRGPPFRWTIYGFGMTPYPVPWSRHRAYVFGKTAYVRLTCIDGREVLIGTRRPEELMRAIVEARQHAADPRMR